MKRGVVKLVMPVKASLAQAETLPVAEAEMRRLVERKTRELEKTIVQLKLRAGIKPTPRNHRKNNLRATPVRKRTARAVPFVDRLRLKAYAGRGGNGAVAFARGPNVRVGPPSGGDAGRGGSVVLVADGGLSTLAGVTRLLRAEAGGNGGTNGRTGRAGRDCVVRVPRGTLVSRVVARDGAALTTEGDEVALRAKAKTVALEPLADLDQDGQRFCLAVGGQGGLGNAAFVSATNRSPREATKGQVVAAVTALLELKSIADVGLVGQPNAGKSSLLYTVSLSSPKVASYPFTTLHPSVGVVKFDDYSSFSMCDIPGIIEGAHRNVGLGLEFLRHIERTHVLCFVVDAGGSDPAGCYRTLADELDRYDPRLRRSKRSVVAANKTDLDGSAEGVEQLRSALASEGTPLFEVSVKRKLGLDALMLHLRDAVRGAASQKD